MLSWLDLFFTFLSSVLIAGLALVKDWGGSKVEKRKFEVEQLERLVDEGNSLLVRQWVFRDLFKVMPSSEELAFWSVKKDALEHALNYRWSARFLLFNKKTGRFHKNIKRWPRKFLRRLYFIWYFFVSFVALIPVTLMPGYVWRAYLNGTLTASSVWAFIVFGFSLMLIFGSLALDSLRWTRGLWAAHRLIKSSRLDD